MDADKVILEKEFSKFSEAASWVDSKMKSFKETGYSFSSVCVERLNGDYQFTARLEGFKL